MIMGYDTLEMMSLDEQKAIATGSHNKNFLLDLLRNDEQTRRQIIHKRKQWLSSLKRPDKAELFFELEMHLKALERFFNISNQPTSQKTHLINRDFSEELQIVRETLNKVINCISLLLEENTNNSLHFNKFLEGYLRKDHERSSSVEQSLMQKSPEESLFLLKTSFTNFREILENLLLLKQGSYTLFYNVGQLISREIALNRYFNPFRLKEFTLHYDRITNPGILKMVKTIEDFPLRRQVSLILLTLFKLMHYLDYIPQRQGSTSQLKRSLLIFSLIYSESQSLIDYIEKSLPKHLRKYHPQSEHMNAELREEFLFMVDSLAFQLRMELQKIFSQKLGEIIHVEKLNELRSSIESSVGLLRNFLQQTCVAITRIFREEINGDTIFEEFVSRLEQSLRLHQDIYIFMKIMADCEQKLNKPEEKQRANLVRERLDLIRDYIFYFHNLSFQLLRHDDHIEFKKYIDRFVEIEPKTCQSDAKFTDFKRLVHTFKMLLETTFAHIGNRSEIQSLEFDEQSANTILLQYIGK